MLVDKIITLYHLDFKFLHAGKHHILRVSCDGRNRVNVPFCAMAYKIIMFPSWGVVLVDVI